MNENLSDLIEKVRQELLRLNSIDLDIIKNSMEQARILYSDDIRQFDIILKITEDDII